MKVLLKMVCGAFALLVVANWASAQDNVQLKYQLKKGEKYIYKKESSVKQTQSVANMKIETEILGNDLSVWTMKEVDAQGNLHIQTENKELNAKIKIGALGEFIYDSKNKDKNKSNLPGGGDPTPLYEKLSGSSLTVVITPMGKVNEIKGYKELVADVLKNNPLADQLGGGSEDAAKVNMSEFFPVFQDKAVSPGDKWEVPFEIKLPKLGAAKGKKIFWYQGESKVGDRKTVKISITSEMAFDLNLNQGDAKVTGKLSITTSKGTVEFDPQQGCIVSLSNEITLSGNLNVNVNNMDIPVTTEQVQQFSMKLQEGSPK